MENWQIKSLNTQIETQWDGMIMLFIQQSNQQKRGKRVSFITAGCFFGSLCEGSSTHNVCEQSLDWTKHHQGEIIINIIQKNVINSC